MLHCGKARIPRTEAGAEDGGRRGTRKIKTEERQEAGKGGEKARGKTEATRKQGKRKVEAR